MHCRKLLMDNIFTFMVQLVQEYFMHKIISMSYANALTVARVNVCALALVISCSMLVIGVQVSTQRRAP